MTVLERKDWKNLENDQINTCLEEIIDDKNPCIVDCLKNFVNIARKATCGECLICREGILQIYLIIKDITEGRGKEDDLDVIGEIAYNLEIGASCQYGNKVGKLLRDGLQNNIEIFEKHLKRKRCDFLICKDYITYHIKGETCVGCGACKQTCSQKAIDGEDGFIHVVNQDICNKCGECSEVCKADAITKAGPVKPKTPDKPIPVGTFVNQSLGGGLMGRRRRKAKA